MAKRKSKGIDWRKFHGAWKISDAELKEIQVELKLFWKTWKLNKSVENWIKEETVK